VTKAFEQRQKGIPAVFQTWGFASMAIRFAKERAWEWSSPGGVSSFVGMLVLA
jgi:hypothetical protein